MTYRYEMNQGGPKGITKWMNEMSDNGYEFVAMTQNGEDRYTVLMRIEA